MSGALRVMHLTHDMGIGGTEQVIKQLISGLDADVVECCVLCLDGQIGPLGVQLQGQGITVDRLHRQPGFDTALIGAIRTLLRKREIDILHCHQYTPYSYGVLAALLTGVRVIYTEHGRFHPDRHSWKRRLVNPLLNVATEAITAISEATRQALIHHEWFPARAISVVYNGIRDSTADPATAEADDAHGPDFPPDTVVFGTIARLDMIKNHRMMLEAFEVVCRQYPQARLLLVGDGPERAVLEEQTRTLGIEASVLFTGFRTDTLRYLTMMDVFLLSSFSEGTSMTLLEAMSHCKPCVVTAVGGNVELIADGHNGLSSASGDTAAFAASMLAILSDPAKGERLGNNARQVFLDRFELGYMIDAYQRLYLA